MVEGIQLLGSGLNTDDHPLVRPNGDSVFRQDIVYGQDGDFGSLVGIKAATEVPLLPEWSTWANKACIGSCEYIQNNSFIFLLYGETTVGQTTTKNVVIGEVLSDDSINVVGYLPPNMPVNYTKDTRIYPYIIDKFLGFTDGIVEPILINIERAKLYQQNNPAPYFREDYGYTSGDKVYVKGYGLYTYKGVTEKIQSLPWSSGNPLNLEKIGTSVNIFGNRYSLINNIQIQNSQLYPASPVDVSADVFKVMKGSSDMGGALSTLESHISTSGFSSFSPNGKIKVLVFASDGGEGYFSIKDVVVDGSVSTIQGFTTKLGECITSCVNTICLDSGGSWMTVTTDTSNPSDCFVSIVNQYDRVSIFISNSNNVNITYSTSGQVQYGVVFPEPKTINFNQELFSITNAGLISKGWTDSQFGFTTPLLPDVIETTYSL